MQNLIRRFNCNIFIIFIIIFIGHLVIKYEIIFSSALIADDARNYVFSLTGDVVTESAQYLGGYIFSRINYYLNNIVLVRLLHLFLYSLSFVILLYAIDTASRKKYFSLIALAIVISAFNPMTSEMISFVNGSYPIYGMLFMSMGLYFAQKSIYLYYDRSSEFLKILILGLLSSLLFFASFLSANLLFLSPFILLCINFRLIIYYKYRLKEIAYLLTVFILPYVYLGIYHLLKSAVYHYNQLEGYTNYSVSHWFYKLNLYENKLLDIYTSSLSNFNSISIWLAIAIFILSYKCVYNAINYPKSSYSGVLGIILVTISSAVITIAAFLVIAPFQYRYVFITTVFLTMFVFISVFLLLHRFVGKIITALFVFMLILINVNALVYSQNHDYTSQVRSQNIMAKEILKKSPKWPDNAQIIIIEDKDMVTVSYNYNHWSTGFLRFVTKKYNINGIIGKQKAMIYQPFRKIYKDHDKSYWYTADFNGKKKSVRKTMVCLLKDRPTFMYVQQPDGTLKEKNYLIINNNYSFDVYRSTDSGLITYMLNANKIDIEKENLFANAIVYNIIGMESVESYEYNGSFHTFNGNEVINATLPVDAIGDYYISFYLKSSGENVSRRYDETSPPMPLLIPPLAIYQVRKDQYRLYLNNESYNIGFEKNSWAKIELRVTKEPARTELYFNDKILLDISEYYPLQNVLTLGKGHKNRFWEGYIGDFKIYNGSKIYYSLDK